MSTIYQKEDEIFNELKDTYPTEVQPLLVKDGLCLSSIRAANPLLKSSLSMFGPLAEELYVRDKRKLIFVAKEPNNSEHEVDYRDWIWYELGKTTAMKKVLAGILEGLHITTADYLPRYTDQGLIDKVYEAFSVYPFAFCNMKKLSGGSKTKMKELWSYAKRDQKILQKQFKEILQGNIIVCFGSSDSEREQDQKNKMINLVKEIIYPEIKDNFKKINNYCHYDEEADLLLIDSYHFSYPDNGGIKADLLVNDLLAAFQDFIKKANYKN